MLSLFRRNLDMRNALLNTLVVLLFIYGSFQLFSDRGIFTLYRLNEEIKQQEQANELLKQREQYLASRVEKLEEGESFDYDYLDEVIREKLGVIKKSEKVIFVEQ